MDLENLRIGSTFTGIGGFELAMKEVFPNATLEFYFENDRFADQTFLKNFPEYNGKNWFDISALIKEDDSGELVPDVNLINMLPDIDILVGGPPCQDLSILKGKNRQGLAGTKSRLFFAFLAILKIKKPKYFLMENVASMTKENRDLISDYLGVEVMEINSGLLTYQNRFRNYWFNWSVGQPNNRGILLPNVVAWSRSTRYPKGRPSHVEERKRGDGKCNTFTTSAGCGGFSSKNYIVNNLGVQRHLTPEECEVGQGFDSGWTSRVSLNQRYKQLGNAVTVPVITHILKGLKNEISN